MTFPCQLWEGVDFNLMCEIWGNRMGRIHETNSEHLQSP